jgi:predicted nucleic acid-binding protein
LIIADTNIISSFSKIHRLELLKHFNDLTISYGVIDEILRSKNNELILQLSSALNEWLKKISVIDLNEIITIQKDHDLLSIVDCELILICKENNADLISDDIDLLNIANEEYSIETYDLS